MDKMEITLAYLRQQHQDQILITMDQAARHLGMSGKTAQNRASAGRFPIPTRKIGGKQMVHLLDLAEFIACGTSQQATAPRRGRPRKPTS